MKKGTRHSEETKRKIGELAKERYKINPHPLSGKLRTKEAAKKRNDTMMQNFPKSYHDKEKLYNKHIVEDKSTTQIAKEWHTTQQIIVKWLKIHGIPYSRRTSPEEFYKTHTKNGDYLRGEKNPRWNKGASEYKDHALLKRVRLKVLARFDGNCILCGKEASIVHHLDNSKSNHDLDELVALCKSCHWFFHGSKYANQHANSISDFARKTGLTRYFAKKHYKIL